MHHIGVYISDDHPEDQALFVSERCCFSDLVEGLSSPCPCGLTMKPWAPESFIQVRILIFFPIISTVAFSIACCLERACVASALLLPSLPSTKENLVEFKSVRWTLPS